MIYFDATRLLEWTGRYTGMEQVAYQLARLIVQREGRLVYFIPARGFIDVTTVVSWQDSAVTYEGARRGSLTQLAKSNPIAAVGELRRRLVLGKVQPVAFGSGDTFFTSDGLWDRQDYIDSLVHIGNTEAKFVHLVHDIVPIVVPHLVHDYMTGAMTEYFTKIAPYIDVLVSISRNTQTDFMSAFGAYTKPVLDQYIFHHGDDMPDIQPIKPACVEGLEGFVLCVGTIEIRKNHMLIYQAYKLAIERGVELPPIVIVGRDGWLSDQTLKLMRDDPAVKDKIIFAGPVPDAELAWCYQNCLYTVMPTYYEGWGLQVAQSLYYGKVAAVSNVGPLPEVGGDLNMYYSPYSPDELLVAMTQLLDSAVLDAKTARIRDEYRPTTWQAALEGVLSHLDS